VRKEFFKSLRPILEDYAKENSIDIILKKENVLIGKTNLDISNNILEIFNKKIKKISVN
jgi:outer membrane protein